MSSQPDTTRIRNAWESAAPGWARWEPTVAAWMAGATGAMLDMAGIAPGARVLDLACGAGSQTLEAARRVGPSGAVLAVDIAQNMLEHVRESARRAGLANVRTLASGAEELAVEEGGFDAAICRLGLMLFASPVSGARAVRRALRGGGKFAAVVFTSPAASPMLSQPMQVLLRHAKKPAPMPGQPGIFSLGAPGALAEVLARSGFTAVEERTLECPLRMASPAEALQMMQEAFGAYRAVVADQPEAVRAAAWTEVAQVLEGFASAGGFEAPAEVLVACAENPGR
jgi:ubiquinone/menaquinone biosynthesis C-methylase UbiE